jgi:hypothetical protein
MTSASAPQLIWMSCWRSAEHGTPRHPSWTVPAAALVAAWAAGEPLLAHWTQTFMGGAAHSFITSISAPNRVLAATRRTRSNCFVRSRSVQSAIRNPQGYAVPRRRPARDVCLDDFLLTGFRRLPVSPNLYRTTIEEGTTLNGKRVVANIAHDVRL